MRWSIKNKAKEFEAGERLPDSSLDYIVKLTQGKHFAHQRIFIVAVKS